MFDCPEQSQTSPTTSFRGDRLLTLFDREHMREPELQWRKLHLPSTIGTQLGRLACLSRNQPGDHQAAGRPDEGRNPGAKQPRGGQRVRGAAADRTGGLDPTHAAGLHQPIAA